MVRRRAKRGDPADARPKAERRLAGRQGFEPR
jgi:hypothetical protein